MTEGDDRDELRRFEALVHASPDFIAIAGIDGRVSFVNAAGRLLAGIPADVDVTQTSITDYLTPEGIAASERVEQPAVVAEGRWSGETTLRDWRDGSGIPVSVTSFLVTDVRTGEPLALATIQRDLRPLLAAAEQAEAARAVVEGHERRQRSLLRHMSDLLVVLGLDGVVLHASPSTHRALGDEDAPVVGRTLWDLVHPDDRAGAAAHFHRLGGTPGPAGPFLLRLVTAHGGLRHYEALTNNLVDDPAIGGVVVTARDVTERVRDQQLQQGQAEVLELMASGADLPEVLTALAHWVEAQSEGTWCSILLTDGPGRLPLLRQGASPSMPASYLAAVAAAAPAIAGSPCALAVSQGEPVLVPDLLADAQWTSTHELARATGLRSCWTFPVLSPATGDTLGTFALYRKSPGVPDHSTQALIDRASHLVGISVDRSRLLARLDHEAHHDALTGLPNRLRLLHALTDALREDGPDRPAPVVIFLDLDRLKIINDSLGHEVGDELLVSIAARLRAAVAPEDQVARFGGDEFVVLARSAVGPGDVESLVVRVLTTVSEVVALHGRDVTPSASAGVVVAGRGQTASQVLRDADIAMYRAKHRGGDGWVLFDRSMRQSALDRLDLEAQVRQAISRDEFLLHYQPVVDMQDGDALVGFEALVRWAHPERGLLLPEAFMGLAEETGLVVPLGEFVLRSATATAAAWSRQTSVEGLGMAVNLAPQQLTSTGLAALVSQCVREAAPWSLGLELTESTAMDDTPGVRQVVQDLADSGAALSIDDFGTGYSSLSYLTRLPVTRLKIDRSFISDLEGRPDAATVAASIVSLSGNLGLSVVAEGVETAGQRDLLLSLGCRLGQGNLFSPPLPADDALRLLQQRRA